MNEYSLEIAIRYHSVEILRLLADHDLLTTDQITDPLLMHAVDTEDADKICFLLNLEKDGVIRGISEEVVRYAMKNATKETIELLVESWPFYAYGDILKIAVEESSIEGVELMIEKDALGRYTDIEILHIAIENESRDIVELLVRGGVDIDSEAYRLAKRLDDRSIYYLLNE